MEYAIKYTRDLNFDEIQILVFILTNEKSHLLEKIDSLKIVARCGCGNCPTVLFAYNIEDEFLKNENLLFSYFGETQNEELVGISIFGNQNIISELEFYSIDGKLEIPVYPILETLKKD